MDEKIVQEYFDDHLVEFVLSFRFEILIAIYGDGLLDKLIELEQFMERQKKEQDEKGYPIGFGLGIQFGKTVPTIRPKKQEDLEIEDFIPSEYTVEFKIDELFNISIPFEEFVLKKIMEKVYFSPMNHHLHLKMRVIEDSIRIDFSLDSSLETRNPAKNYENILKEIKRASMDISGFINPDCLSVKRKDTNNLIEERISNLKKNIHGGDPTLEDKVKYYLAIKNKMEWYPKDEYDHNKEENLVLDETSTVDHIREHVFIFTIPEMFVRIVSFDEYVLKSIINCIPVNGDISIKMYTNIEFCKVIVYLNSRLLNNRKEEEHINYVLDKIKEAREQYAEKMEIPQ